VTDAVNPAGNGTKMAARHELALEPGASASIRLRLMSAEARTRGDRAATVFGAAFDRVLQTRRREADAFYATVIDPSLDADAANVMRQALAGMLWGKQYYEYHVHTWLREHGVNPWSAAGPEGGPRNTPWFHLDAGDVISMPDKWEYPWFAAWDLALQTVPLALVDVDFAKGQMELLLEDRYLHPNGQIPAYEWNFSDVNPPLHAWSALMLYERERKIRGAGDAEFLGRVFTRLLTNFTWWVNRKDPDDRNLFQGGFLGLDNIGVFDRSAPLPGGGTLEQADGTAWMALYCQAMLQMALELTKHDAAYASMAAKFAMHFAWIAAAMSPPDGEALWSEEDGFYYDVMRMPDGSTRQLRVRSLVGLLPMCAATVIEPGSLERVPDLVAQWEAFVEEYEDSIPALAQRPGPSVGGKRLVSLVGVDRLRRILAIMLDESEFLGPFGIRAISRYHAEHPYVFDIAGQEFRVEYEPAESHTGMFGGNSNWRGPVWFPMNVVILRGLRQLHAYYGDNLKVECPTGSGNEMNLLEVAEEIGRRLTSIFLRDDAGRRPVFGGIDRFQSDPHWRELLLFHEYFHGDNGAGLGASHQTGWTGLVALLFAQAAGDATGRRQGAMSAS
jgi:mannosylglycerate hydrolase MGH1-like protein